MAVCPRCNLQNLSGAFCPQCGGPTAPAPTSFQPGIPTQQAPGTIQQPLGTMQQPLGTMQQPLGTMAQPPQGGTPYPPYTQGNPYAHPPAAQYSQPPYGQAPPQNMPGVYINTPAPPKRKGLLIAGISVAAAAVLGLGAWAIVASLDRPHHDTPVVANTRTPTTPTTPDVKPSTPPATPTTPPAQPGTQPTKPPATPTPAATAGAFPATVLATGDLHVTFRAYDSFGENEILLADSSGGKLTATIAGFYDGTMGVDKTFESSLGTPRDVGHGQLNNDGVTQGIITASGGVLIVTEDREVREYPNLNADHLFVADFDGDGQAETAQFSHTDSTYKLTLTRYAPGQKEGTAVGSWSSNQPMITSPQLAYLQVKNRALLIGVGDMTDKALPLKFYTIDPSKGLQEMSVSFPIPLRGNDLITGIAVANVAGKTSVLVSYQGQPSYIEIFDIESEGSPSRGKIMLPDNLSYGLILGKFKNDNKLDLLALATKGKWTLFGF